jgi:ferredoxin-thioredoxin reductase catalytic subunit
MLGDSKLPEKEEIKRLYETLQKLQEAKGYYFNTDQEKVFDLLESLIKNKNRYGHMSCPCRLASGIREKDKDIICPCVYREEDVRDYGSCYCALYVSKEWKSGEISKKFVPERRPLEMFFS